MDLGTLAPATTPNWFDAYSPTTLIAVCGLRRRHLCPDRSLKVDVGARVNHYDYRFSSCLSGWGSANGAATPSCSGLIALSNNSFNPKFNLSYKFNPDLMAYATVSSGFRPGGGNAVYPTTGAAWGGAFQQQNYTSGKWPATYEPDRVLSYELGEKARFLDHRLTVNASIYYEDWRHVQLEAYPNDWALNINGNYVSIYGADIDLLADLGAGLQFEVAAGYLYEWLEGGPHWVITPVHKMPEVAPESGTVALNYPSRSAAPTRSRRDWRNRTPVRAIRFISRILTSSRVRTGNCPAMTWSMSARGLNFVLRGALRCLSTTSPTSTPSWRACLPKMSPNPTLPASKPTSR
jgi:iron complex outermembrane receptor protein